MLAAIRFPWLFRLPWFKGFDACGFLGVIWFRDRLGPSLLVHELTHLTRQRAMGQWQWLRRYRLDKDFRKAEEVAAMAVQLKFMPEIHRAECLAQMAQALATGYGLSLTPEQAEAAIRERLAQ